MIIVCADSVNVVESGGESNILQRKTGGRQISWGNGMICIEKHVDDECNHDQKVATCRTRVSIRLLKVWFRGMCPVGRLP